jgi:hydrogenase expression/formation protein HypE
LFINTTGIGQMMDPVPSGPESLREGDELLVTGPVGCHGIAVLCAREELEMEPPPRSDCASLLVATELLRHRLGFHLRAMRDATRGGVAAVLHEWSEACGQTLTINEQDIPVKPAVRGVCELLGLDPLHMANEGTMVFAVAKGFATEAIESLKEHAGGVDAKKIGEVATRGISPVTIRRTLGAQQPLDDPLGSPLPRVC